MPLVNHTMRHRTFLKSILAVALVAVLLASPLGGASHSTPRNDTRSAGNMQCNTNAVPVTKAGSLSPASQRLIITHNLDNGHLLLTASGSAIGPVGCTFEIRFTGFSCPIGTAPNCAVSQAGKAMCSANNNVCATPATLDLDFSFDFQVPSVTTHLYIYYDLVVWTGEDVFKTDPVTVASGQIEYWEPPLPIEEVTLPVDTPI